MGSKWYKDFFCFYNMLGLFFLSIFEGCFYYTAFDSITYETCN